MASVRVEDGAFGDLRYDRLAMFAGLADADHARGKMLRIWRQCVNEQRYILPLDDIVMILGQNGPDALARSGLGEIVKKGVRIKGTKGRIEWLAKLRENGKKGGRPTTNTEEYDNQKDNQLDNQMGGQSSNPLSASSSSVVSADTGGEQSKNAPAPEPEQDPGTSNLLASFDVPLRNWHDSEFWPAWVSAHVDTHGNGCGTQKASWNACLPVRPNAETRAKIIAWIHARAAADARVDSPGDWPGPKNFWKDEGWTAPIRGASTPQTTQAKRCSRCHGYGHEDYVDVDGKRKSRECQEPGCVKPWDNPPTGARV